MTAPIERLSPDERFKLVIRKVPTGKGTWSVLDIEVRSTEDNRLIGTTTRNYPGDSILHFVKQDGIDYLVLSENYHGGYGVMNLATGEKAVFEPEPSNPDKYEPFWCWADPVRHDPDTKQLVITGCYWGAPYDRVTFDFSNPMCPPYPILEIEDEPFEDDRDDDSA